MDVCTRVNWISEHALSVLDFDSPEFTSENAKHSFVGSNKKVYAAKG